MQCSTHRVCCRHLVDMLSFQTQKPIITVDNPTDKSGKELEAYLSKLELCEQELLTRVISIAQKQPLYNGKEAAGILVLANWGKRKKPDQELIGHN